MDINDSFRSAYSALVSETSSVLPFYLVGASVPAVLRVGPIVAGVLSYLSLRRRGNIDEITSIAESVDPSRLQESGALENPEFLRELETKALRIVDLVFVPEVVAALAVSITLSVLLALLLNAVVGAGQLHAVYSVLTDGEPVADGVRGVLRDTRPFVLLSVIETVILLALTAVFAVVGLAAGSSGGLVGGLLAALVVLVWLTAVVLVHTFFVFAPQSIVVQNRGAVGGIRGNVGFLRSNPTEFVAYAVFFLAVLIGFASVAGALASFGAQAASSVILLTVVSPFVGVVKTDMFVRHAEGDDAVDVPSASPDLGDVRAGVREGWSEMVSFTRSNLVLVLVSAAIVAVSFEAAWTFASANVGFETSIADRLSRVTPVGAFLNFSANNWSVAVAQSYAGFALVVPTLFSLAFNGAALGVLTATEENTAELIAFVVPHGSIEIPALLISGALGIHLGASAWRYARGSLDTPEVADEIRRAYRVLVGLAVLFVVAGFVEAFVSPFYYGPLLGI